MTAIIAGNDMALVSYYRSLRFGRKLSERTAAQYCSVMRSVQTAMAGGPEDSKGLARYLAMLAPTSRIKVATVYASWLLFWRASDEEKGFKHRAPFPSENQIQLARLENPTQSYSDDVLKALRLLAAICQVGPQRIAARHWGDVSKVDGQLALKIYLRSQGRTFYQMLGALGAEALEILRVYQTGGAKNRSPVPTAVLLAASPSDPFTAPTRGELERLLRAAGAGEASDYSEAVKANLSTLPPENING